MEFLAAALVLLPKLVALGMDIEPFVSRLIQVAKGDPVTPEDWADLHQREDELRARLNDRSKDV